jgi:topoisomerase IA-like protein
LRKLNFNFMKKENREMLKTIVSNQLLIMKALKIEIPIKETPKKEMPKKTAIKKQSAKKATVKAAAKKAGNK